MQQPNFLLFVTDQHRADHLACYGNPMLATPNIDALAAQGCVFDEFHVATPICQPNRASLMTGRMPSAHGLQMNGRELSLGETTFVQSLQAAGYRTALAGKSHLQNITALPALWPGEAHRLPGDARRRYPGVYGQEVWKRWEDDPAFDLTLPYYGFEQVALTIGHADEQHGHWRRWLRAQTPDADRLIGPDNAIPTPEFALTALRQAWRTRVPEELYPTRYIAQRSCDMLAEFAQGTQPFFLQCSFPDPHHPFTPPGRYWDMFRPDDVALPASFDAPANESPQLQWLREARARNPQAKPGYGAFACSAREAREGLALNYGSIACVDDAVGRVMAQLRTLGMDRDTVVMFTSDHGELLGEYGLMFKGGLHCRPLVRVPFVWRDTEGQRRATRTQALAQTTDIAATVLARAGLPPVNGMQGKNLLGLARGSDAQVREHLVVEEESQRIDFGLARRNRMRTLRTPRHRLTLYDGQAWGELFDLQEDPREQHNLWSDPGAAHLRGELGTELAYAMLDLADTSPYPDAAA